MLNFSSILTFFINSVQDFDTNFKSWSLIITFGILLCQTHMLKNNFVVLIVVAFVWVDANLTNFENLSTTTKMASVPSHSKKHVIKSIETISNGHEGFGPI